ncbi:MAG: GspE/PulE family protein [Planctomycetota bacterium]|jgi:type II secretory ATPase GspE/PulE/Tfp pilus assembly ATPase PilB-like protein
MKHEQDRFVEQALIEAGVVTAEVVEDARRTAVEQDRSSLAVLQEMEVVTSRQLALATADVCESPFVDLAHYEPNFQNAQLVPRSIAERYLAFPLFMVGGTLTIALEDPLDLDAVDQLRELVRTDVEPVLAEAEQLRQVIARAYSYHNKDDSGTTDSEIVVDDDLDISQPVVAAVNQILADAIDRGASDVHINPDERELHVRFRVDGVLIPIQGPPLSMHSGLVQRIKVMANLDLTQSRRPQDGKFRQAHKGRAVDIRTSTIPTVNGENVVLRLLANDQVIHDFHELGVPAPMASDLSEMLSQPYGMVLVTGPTGSGKTTTLYTALSRINDPGRNIMTIEDPVEIRMQYVRQIQVQDDVGLSFATALRAILRQDPDIVLVGEVRDTETASISLQAALTGHMVLSTLHTNDAVGSIARLRDFGMAPFIINSAVLGALAQRLVRRICQHCIAPATVGDREQRLFHIDPDDAQFQAGRGCARCGQTGFRGRLGIYELLKLTSPVQDLVERDESSDALRSMAVAMGMRQMWHDGLEKARLGVTTLEEVAKSAPVTMVASGSGRRLVA